MKKYAVHISIESSGSILVDAKSKKEAVEKAHEQVGKCCPSVKAGLRGLKLDENVTFYKYNSCKCTICNFRYRTALVWLVWL